MSFSKKTAFWGHEKGNLPAACIAVLWLRPAVAHRGGMERPKLPKRLQ